MADPPLIPVETIYYKQYVKEALVEALRAVFAIHPDEILRKTRVGIDFSMKETEYPSILVRFYERQISNAGVAHFEMMQNLVPPIVTDLPATGVLAQVVQLDSDQLYYTWDIEDEVWVALDGYAPNEASTSFIKYKHYLYQGDIEFAVYALSSYDRDLIADSLVQTIAMGDLESYSDLFLRRIYRADVVEEPVSAMHYINLNTDIIQGFGETQQMAPWLSDDVLMYQTSYRIAIHGEFYSRTPPNVVHGLVEKVEAYPYNPAVNEPVPDPDWAGPDGIHGTTDDEPDPSQWSEWV